MKTTKALDHAVAEAVAFAELETEDSNECINYQPSRDTMSDSERSRYSMMGCYDCEGYEFFCMSYGVRRLGR